VYTPTSKWLHVNTKIVFTVKKAMGNVKLAFKGTGGNMESRRPGGNEE